MANQGTNEPPAEDMNKPADEGRSAGGRTAGQREILTEREAQQARARQAAQESAEGAPDKPLTETEPGGRYLAEDGETLIDAEGKPLK